MFVEAFESKRLWKSHLLHPKKSRQPGCRCAKWINLEVPSNEHHRCPWKDPGGRFPRQITPPWKHGKLATFHCTAWGSLWQWLSRNIWVVQFIPYHIIQTTRFSSLLRSGGSEGAVSRSNWPSKSKNWLRTVVIFQHSFKSQLLSKLDPRNLSDKIPLQKENFEQG